MVLVSLVQSNLALPWVPEIFFSRVTRGFVGREKKTFRAGHFLRLDGNRKPHTKTLWHPW